MSMFSGIGNSVPRRGTGQRAMHLDRLLRESGCGLSKSVMPQPVIALAAKIKVQWTHISLGSRDRP